MQSLAHGARRPRAPPCRIHTHMQPKAKPTHDAPSPSSSHCQDSISHINVGICFLGMIHAPGNWGQWYNHGYNPGHPSARKRTTLICNQGRVKLFNLGFNISDSGTVLQTSYMSPASLLTHALPKLGFSRWERDVVSCLSSVFPRGNLML